MARKKLAAIVFSLGTLQASSVMALGLGELKLESFLNEPLKASVDLLNTGGLHQEEIKIRLATREDFDKLGIDRAYFLTNITFEVMVDERGRAKIVMGSEEPVLEPYLDFIVEARWPSGRLLREYTVLIDPPVFSETATVVSASDRVEEVEGIPAPSKKKAEAAVGSGTRVDVRQKSNLAPGEMPQRNFSAAASPSPMAGNRYMINRDETLWDIASRAKPAGTTVHQTMLDIQRLNPKAFINGNINQIKAGYIVYLPAADDISSSDLSSALAEVNAQNEAWREGRAAQEYASRGPALRISADSQEASSDLQPGSGGTAASEDDGSAAATAMMDPATLEGADDTERLAAMQQQVETLQRIVNLKDEQIAALQSELGNVAPEIDAMAAAAELEAGAATMDEQLSPMSDQETAESAPVEEMAEAMPAAEVTAPAPVAPSKPKAPPAKAATPDDGGSWVSYLLYGLGAVVLGLFAFLFMRSRRQDEDSAPPTARVAPVADVFSDVKLPEQAPEVEAAAEEEDAGEEQTDNRGYGERKHDQYASNVEASDALAEADIYIAYGRHPQAIDLLNNALANEPNNPVYRLKLVEIYSELGDRAAATAQFERLQAIGDASSIAKGEEFLAQLDRPTAAAGAGAAAAAQATEQPDDGPGLPPNPLEMMSPADEPLQDEFSGLEIEDEGAATGELDLSDDFDATPAADGDDEELVIADDANGLSTKLDLARAYLDMGDDDGARQILDEVVAEGTEDLKAEARALLDRIGE